MTMASDKWTPRFGDHVLWRGHPYRHFIVSMDDDKQAFRIMLCGTEESELFRAEIDELEPAPDPAVTKLILGATKMLDSPFVSCDPAMCHGECVCGIKETVEALKLFPAKGGAE